MAGMKMKTGVGLMKRTAALLLAAGVAFSSGAWGQTMVQSVSNPKTIAAEYFGTAKGRVVAARSAANAPTTFRVEVRDAAIGPRNQGDLTISLTRATFVDRVPLSQFESSDEHAVLSWVEGGEAGDSSVSVRVAVEDGDFGVGGSITFTVPDLRVAPGVYVSYAALTPPQGSLGSALIDASVTGVRRTISPFPDVIGEAPNAGEDAPPEPIYEFSQAFIHSTCCQPGEAREVDVADRKVLVPRMETDRPPGLLIGSYALLELVGRKALAEKNGADEDVSAADFPGHIVATAVGSFQTDDKVIVHDAAETAGREMTRNEDGSYSDRVTMEEAGISAYDYEYVPGGVEDLWPGFFSSTLAIQYDDPENASGPVTGSRVIGEIKYRGVSVAGYAHGIVKADDGARTYLRVGCADTRACSVFASCSDQAGGGYFGHLGDVPAGGLEVYDSDEIAHALGGGWDMGLGRCDLLSNGVLEVQNMLNQGSININNSLVTDAAGVLTRE